MKHISSKKLPSSKTLNERVDTPDVRLSTEEEETNLTISSDVPGLLANLPPKMQRFINLYVTGQYTLPKLAQLLEVHPNTLGNWLRRKDVKEIIADMQTTTHDVVAMQLKSLTLAAVDKLNKLINSPIDGVALQAVKDVLDRAGHKPKQEIKIDKTVKTFEEKINDLIKQTIVDVDYEMEEDEEND